MTRVTGPLASTRARWREVPGTFVVVRVLHVVGRLPWLPLALVAVALTIRLPLVGFGLPYELDPDERDFVESAWRMIEQGHWDPRWYGHPAATLMGLMALVDAGYAAVGMAFGTFGDIASVGKAYRADVTHFFMIGRIVTAISGAAVVLATFALIRRVGVATFWAAVGALVVAVATPMVDFSSVVRADMMLTALLLAILIVMLKALERPSGGLFALAGILLGLAVTSKYTGALGLAPILAVNVILVVKERITPRTGLIWLGGTALASLCVAFIVAPYLFINIADTLAWIRFEAQSEHLDSTSAGLLGNVWAYLTDALPWALGTIGTTLGLLGLATMVRSGRPWLVPLTFVAYLAFISALALWWLRWALPLVPLAAVGAVTLLERLDARFRAWLPHRWSSVVRIALAGLIVVPLASPTVDAIRAKAADDDTRLRAIDWIHANVPDGATIFIDSYTTQVSSDRYEVLVTWAGELHRWSDVSDKLRPDGWFSTVGAEWHGTPARLLETLATHHVDYVVLNQQWIDLYRARGPSGRDLVAVYEGLLAAFPVVRTFDRDDASVGWPIMILRTEHQRAPRMFQGPLGG